MHEAEKRGRIWALKGARLVGTLRAETYAYIHRYLNMDVHFIIDERVKTGKQAKYSARNESCTWKRRDVWDVLSREKGKLLLRVQETGYLGKCLGKWEGSILNFNLCFQLGEGWGPVDWGWRGIFTIIRRHPWNRPQWCEFEMGKVQPKSWTFNCIQF